ncbi:MAG: hypothetical protein ACREM3_24290 [Candidatus Rokuibacteriota bacterium]
MTWPRGLAWRSTGALLLTAVTARPAGAHGFGQRYDLPVPLWLWVAGAAAAVLLSFVVIGLFVRGSPGARGYPRVNLLRSTLGRFLADRRLRLAAQAVSVGLLVLVVAAGLSGDQNPTRNLAPIWVWVIWWVGFAYVSALAGNLWAVVNPWAAAFGWAEALVRRLGGDELTFGWPYPRGLGMWPAIVLFAAFAWAELVYGGRAIPAQLALMVTVYSLITWTGMALVGRDVWLRHGDPFAAAFGLLARFSPTEIRVTDPAACRGCGTACRPGRDGCLDCGECFERAAPAGREWNLRPYGAGLVHTDDVSPSMVVFVLLLLSTVAFDGFTATPAWAALDSALYAALAPLGGARLTVIGTLGLLGFALAFTAVYALFAAAMARAGEGALSTGEVARVFVLSLVPIAIAYHLAHYFTYLLIQGQLVIRLASDPFGFGWNLFGTARYRPDIGIVGARFAWYSAVIAIVLGHIIAVWIAHVIALRRYPDRRTAIRSQVPMLVLMVGYTIVSLWIIAQPIVESSPQG